MDYLVENQGTLGVIVLFLFAMLVAGCIMDWDI